VARNKKRQKQLDAKRKTKSLRQKAVSEQLIIEPTKETGIPALNYNACLKAVTARDPKVWDLIIKYLLFFESHHFTKFSTAAIKVLNEFVQITNTALMDEEFVPNDNHAQGLVQVGHLYQHIVALTGYETTDGPLRNVLITKDNAAKVLMLQNPRCVTQISQDNLFAVSPILASMWYQTYLLGISSPTNVIQANMYNHIKNIDSRWEPYSNHVSGMYFSSTYHCPEHVRNLKAIMNTAMKKAIKEKLNWTFTNNPDPKSIAIITNRWHRNHAVYKSAGPLVEQWKDKYKLTLIWTGEHNPDTIVTDYFDSVHKCYFRQDGGIEMPEALVDNDFQMVYFPDIGMSDESIWLSNCRMAPIQAVGYGHPDTTGDNNEIDYHFGGDVEKDCDPEAYSETRVMIPGLAQEPAWPTYERKHNYKADGIVRINCVWGPDKYNNTLLQIVGAINQRVIALKKEAESEPVLDHEFHFFASPGVNRYAALPSFVNEARKIVPNMIMHNAQEYYDYMENAEQHDLSLNSFPFGCYNVLIESLYMGLPFITMVGSRFYNRAGMWLNDQVGMSENNVTSPRDFVERAAELIVDPEKLAAQREHLASLNLKERLFTLKGNYFLEALEYTLKNHPFTETKLIGEPNDQAE